MTYAAAFVFVSLLRNAPLQLKPENLTSNNDTHTHTHSPEWKKNSFFIFLLDYLFSFFFSPIRQLFYALLSGSQSKKWWIYTTGTTLHGTCNMEHLFLRFIFGNFSVFLEFTPCKEREREITLSFSSSKSHIYQGEKSFLLKNACIDEEYSFSFFVFSMKKYSLLKRNCN